MTVTMDRTSEENERLCPAVQKENGPGKLTGYRALKAVWVLN